MNNDIQRHINIINDYRLVIEQSKNASDLDTGTGMNLASNTVVILRHYVVMETGGPKESLGATTRALMEHASNKIMRYLNTIPKRAVGDYTVFVEWIRQSRILIIVPQILTELQNAQPKKEERELTPQEQEIRAVALRATHVLNESDIRCRLLRVEDDYIVFQYPPGTENEAHLSFKECIGTIRFIKEEVIEPPQGPWYS